jgi:flagella basal body P-ring formation protein FlgA
MRCCAELGRIGIVVLVVLGGTALLEPASAQANPPSFERRVAAAIAARWGVDASVVRVEPAPSRLEWPADDATFELSGSGADGQWLLDVRQGDSASRLIVRSGILATETVAAHDLARGLTLADADLSFSTSVQWRAPRRDERAVETGWITNRRVTTGEPLREPAVSPPPAVRPGDAIRVVWSAGGITISLPGTAAGQAAIGERVNVRAETGKRLSGIVTEIGVVRIDGPGLETR